MMRWLPALAILAAAGCATGYGEGPRVYLNRDVTRVAVLPPFMETIDVEAWKEFWPYVIEGVKRHGYAVLDAQKVDEFYAKNKFHGDPAEVKLYKTEEIAKELGVDAVFYSNILQWGYKYAVVYSEYAVEAEFELADGKTGERLWHGKGCASESETISAGGGKEGAVVSLIGVFGKAFLSRKSRFCRECVGEGMRTLPWAGYAPPPENDGTKPAEAQSEEKPSGSN